MGRGRRCWRTRCEKGALGLLPGFELALPKATLAEARFALGYDRSPLWGLRLLGWEHLHGIQVHVAAGVGGAEDDGGFFAGGEFVGA